MVVAYSLAFYTEMNPRIQEIQILISDKLGEGGGGMWDMRRTCGEVEDELEGVFGVFENGVEFEVCTEEVEIRL